MTAEQRILGKRGVSCTVSALVVEGMAMREAMCDCKNRGIKDVRFESDSMQLIRAINLRSPSLEIYGTVEDIFLLSAHFDVVDFVWIPCWRNGEADGLAKRALVLYEQGVSVAELMPSPN